jgi:hypothetical protein
MSTTMATSRSLPEFDSLRCSTGIAFAGEYLKNFFASRLAKFPPHTLIVITFDEAGLISLSQLNFSG